jgi:hypothetical protein
MAVDNGLRFETLSHARSKPWSRSWSWSKSRSWSRSKSRSESRSRSKVAVGGGEVAKYV